MNKVVTRKTAQIVNYKHNQFYSVHILNYIIVVLAISAFFSFEGFLRITEYKLSTAREVSPLRYALESDMERLQ